MDPELEVIQLKTGIKRKIKYGVLATSFYLIKVTDPDLLIGFPDWATP